MLTKPLLLHATTRTLLLNLDTGVGGEVRVAICDGEATYSPAQGSGATSLRCAKELPGLGLYAAVPLTRNSLSAAVTWAGGSTLESAAERGKPIRLLFTMEDAWLFSFRFE